MKFFKIKSWVTIICGVPVWARRLGSLSAFLGPPLPRQTAAPVMVTFSDFHGKSGWRPQPLTKLRSEDVSPSPTGERNGLTGKVGPEAAGGELMGSHPEGCLWYLSSELPEWWGSVSELQVYLCQLDGDPRNLKRKKLTDLTLYQLKLLRRKMGWTLNNEHSWRTYHP